jgi:hypothetical protein
MFFDRMYYELRLMGKQVIATPVCILLVSILLIGILRLSQTKMIAVFSACLEMFLPLAAGVFVVMLCGHDSAVELQLTLPTPYRRTVFSRSGLIVGWTALVALISSGIISSFRLAKVLPFELAWPPLLQWLTGQLLWLAPLLWFVAIGLFLALLLRSRVASIALLGGIWVTENIMYGLLIGTTWLHPVFLFATTLTPLATLSSFWLTNRSELIGTALLFLLIGWFQLHDTEALLQKPGGEE